MKSLDLGSIPSGASMIETCPGIYKVENTYYKAANLRKKTSKLKSEFTIVDYLKEPYSDLKDLDKKLDSLLKKYTSEKGSTTEDKVKLYSFYLPKENKYITSIYDNLDRLGYNKSEYINYDKGSNGRTL